MSYQEKLQKMIRYGLNIMVFIFAIDWSLLSIIFKNCFAYTFFDNIWFSQTNEQKIMLYIYLKYLFGVCALFTLYFKIFTFSFIIFLSYCFFFKIAPPSLLPLCGLCGTTKMRDSIHSLTVIKGSGILLEIHQYHLIILSKFLRWNILLFMILKSYSFFKINLCL